MTDEVELFLPFSMWLLSDFVQEWHAAISQWDSRALRKVFSSMAGGSVSVNVERQDLGPPILLSFTMIPYSLDIPSPVFRA